MSLSSAELSQVAAELNAELAGGVVQKVHLPRPKLCYLELRQPGRTTLLCVSAEPQVARLSVATLRPLGPDTALGFQRLLRLHLVGAKWKGAESRGAEVALAFQSGDAEVRLTAQLRGAGELRLERAGRRIGAPPKEDLPPQRGASEHADRASRLNGDGQPFALARAAEALFLPAAESRRADELRRRSLAPLEAKRTRLHRTLEKVAAEAGRRPAAEEHRRLGELVSRNLTAIPKGAKTARLTEYGPDGPLEVQVAIDPSRSAREQAQWHFKQYKRFLHGSEVASRRQGELANELRALEERIEQLKSAPPVELAEDAPPKRGPRESAERKPYRVYRSGEARIWVGKDARGSDELTFKASRPHDVWLHARGVGGSHVVVPLGKGEDISQELLLDAAHLALHHSQAKGEPRGEVAYTRVKHVRRVKGGAAGQVTYSQEKTFVVRVEPARLDRLARSAAD